MRESEDIFIESLLLNHLRWTPSWVLLFALDKPPIRSPFPYPSPFSTWLNRNWNGKSAKNAESALGFCFGSDFIAFLSGCTVCRSKHTTPLPFYLRAKITCATIRTVGPKDKECIHVLHNTSRSSENWFPLVLSVHSSRRDRWELPES